MEAGWQMKNIFKAIVALVALVLAGGGHFWW